MTAKQPDEAERYALDLIEVIRRYDHLPHETHTSVIMNTLWFVSYRALEDATLHARIEDERQSLLQMIESTRLLIERWQPMTPDDYDLFRDLEQDDSQ